MHSHTFSQGELKEGLYDGHGVYSWPDGAQYTGEWQAGL